MYANVCGVVEGKRRARGHLFPGTLSGRLAGFGSWVLQFLSLVQVGNFYSAIQFTNSFLFILPYLLSF